MPDKVIRGKTFHKQGGKWRLKKKVTNAITAALKRKVKG
jgi:hypothetical protein